VVMVAASAGGRARIAIIKTNMDRVVFEVMEPPASGRPLYLDIRKSFGEGPEFSRAAPAQPPPETFRSGTGGRSLSTTVLEWYLRLDPSLLEACTLSEEPRDLGRSGDPRITLYI
jgi:hypothetical protein